MREWLRGWWQRDGTEPDLDLPGLFSLAALRRAWLRVRANGGAAGVDGVTIRKFEATLTEQLTALQTELVAGTYRPHPVRRILVPKQNGEPRPLSIWVVRDRIVQRLVYDYLEPLYEPLFLDCSFGFRPGRGVAEAVARMAAERDAHRRWVVDGDIRECFDSIPPKGVLAALRQRVYHPAVLRLVEQWLEAEIFNTWDGRPAKAGVSQGNALSPLLCNVYLHPFDVALTEAGYHLVRYADDWVILCRRRPEAEAARVLAGQVLGRLRLEMHPVKTRVVHVDEGFGFLGYTFVRNMVVKQ